MTNTRLPTRAEFLANGLVPTTVSPDFEDCITLCAPENPVKLPCGHVFNRESIVNDLTKPHNNRCPPDRSTLFSLPEEETPLRLNARLQATVLQANREAGLISAQFAAAYDTFSFEFNRLDMDRVITNSNAYLHERTQASGLALISAEYLAPRIVAMANLILGIAIIRGCPYDPPVRGAWLSIVNHLRTIIASNDGHEMSWTPWLFRTYNRRVWTSAWIVGPGVLKREASSTAVLTSP